MERLKIKIKISGGEFEFSERNKKDVDFTYLQQQCRNKQFEFLQANIKDQDVLIAMLMAEMEKVYTPVQINLLLLSDKKFQLKFIYDSFKIENGKTTIDEFAKLIDESEYEKVLQLIDELENNRAEEKNNLFQLYVSENGSKSLNEIVEDLSNTEKQKFAEIVYLKKKKQITGVM